MAEPPSSRQCLEFPTVTPQKLLSILADLADLTGDGMDDLVAGELRVARIALDAWRIYLPVFSAKSPASGPGFEALKDRLKLAYKTVTGFDVGRGADHGYSVALSGLLELVDGAILAALSCKGPLPADDPGGDKLLLAKGPEEQLAPVFADVIRKGRDVRSAGAHRLADGQVAGLLLFTDDPLDYGAVSSYLVRHDLPVEVRICVPVGLGPIRLWLEEGTSPPQDTAARDLARILHAARQSGAVPGNLSDLICLMTDADSAEIYYHAPGTITDAAPAAQTVPRAMDPLQPFDVASIAVIPDAEAQAALTDHIQRLRRQVGYRVGLEPVRRGMSADMDLEPLSEQIDALQLQIDQIRALGAAQRRLMRFSDAQLPAMIDGLRKLHPDKLKDGSILYAASHSAGRGEPAHYLSYDPAETFMRVAEIHWRAQTDPHPISYWLEPFVAEAQLERPSNTQVFVPTGTFLVPSLAHFGGDIDETLRLVLGNLFDDDNPLMQDKKRSAHYLFTPSLHQDFRFEVEVIDGADFADLDQSLHWLNDYLQVRSPTRVQPDRLHEVARGLYEGVAADALREDIDRDLADLDKHWTQTRESINADAMAFVTSISEEIAAVSERIADLHGYLQRAGREMAGLETVARDAARILKAQDGVMATLEAKDAQMVQARDTFDWRMTSELELAEDLVTDSQERIEALQARLQKIKDWGAR